MSQEACHDRARIVVAQSEEHAAASGRPAGSPTPAQSAEHKPAKEDLLHQRREHERDYRERDERCGALVGLLYVRVWLDSNASPSSEVDQIDAETRDDQSQ